MEIKTKCELTDSALMAMISEYEKSNMSIAEFCEYSDIDEATFGSWQKRYAKLKNPLYFSSVRYLIVIMIKVKYPTHYERNDTKPNIYN